MKKKIIILSTRSLTLNLFLKNIYNKFKNNGYTTYASCTDIHNLDKAFDKKISVSFPFLQFKEIINIFAFLKKFYYLFIFLKRHRDYIIFVHTPLASHLIRICNFFLNIKIYYFVHGFRFHTKEKKIKYYINYFIEKTLKDTTYAYITINNEDYKIVKYYFKKKCIKVNGVGTDLLTKDISKEFENKKLIIGVIAAYRKNKGYDKLLQIANNVRINKNIIFKCFGYDTHIKYSKTAKLLNLKNIIFNNFTKNINYEITKFHILLHLSEREGLSVAIIDSLKHSVPVIAYNIRGVNDLIKNDFNGFLFNLGEIDNIVSKINQLYLERKLLRHVAKNAKLSINKSFSNDYICNEIYSFINE